MTTVIDPQQAELLGNIMLAGILGVIIGTIVMAMFMPIFNMGSLAS